MTTQEYHVPVLLAESVAGLNIVPDGVYVDVTFGGGGHSRLILEKLGPKGRLIAFDQDREARENQIDDERFTFVNHNFKYMKNFLRYLSISKINGLIADLGVSSHHFDSPHRGFSFRFDGLLDMRMNTESSLDANKVINTYSAEQLSSLFWNYADLKESRRLALAIVSARQISPINTVEELVNCISKIVPKQAENKFLAKVFQAIRIEVNQEMEALKELLFQCSDFITEGGRLVVISYHSAEDRMVKNFIRSGNMEGSVVRDLYGNVNVPFEAVGKVITPDDSEVDENSRSRSAKLRIAERVKMSTHGTNS